MQLEMRSQDPEEIYLKILNASTLGTLYAVQVSVPQQVQELSLEWGLK